MVFLKPLGPSGLQTTARELQTTFQNVWAAYVAHVLFFCHLLLLFDAGFSGCVLFFLLFVLLSLPLLRFNVVYGVAFVAAASCCCYCLCCCFCLCSGVAVVEKPNPHLQFVLFFLLFVPLLLLLLRLLFWVADR